VSWDEIHNLMRDEQEDSDHEWVQRAKYLFNVF
jgi:hypothetical protein